MKKSINKTLHIIVLNVAWLFYRALYSSFRFEVKNVHLREKARAESPNHSFIFALWHEQLLSCMSAKAWTEPYLALASKSKDGDFAAIIAKRIGFIPVRGSSRKNNVDKGGKEALFEFIHKLKEGTSGGLTIDGPKGPRRKCKPGIILMALKSGSPIIPLIGLPSSYWEFNSWDRFRLAKPFSKITMIYGEPLYFQGEISDENIAKCSLVLEEALFKLNDEYEKIIYS